MKLIGMLAETAFQGSCVFVLGLLPAHAIFGKYARQRQSEPVVALVWTFYFLISA